MKLVLHKLKTSIGLVRRNARTDVEMGKKSCKPFCKDFEYFEQRQQPFKHLKFLSVESSFNNSWKYNSNIILFRLIYNRLYFSKFMIWIQTILDFHQFLSLYLKGGEYLLTVFPADFFSIRGGCMEYLPSPPQTHLKFLADFKFFSEMVLWFQIISFVNRIKVCVMISGAYSYFHGGVRNPTEFLRILWTGDF